MHRQDWMLDIESSNSHCCVQLLSDVRRFKRACVEEEGVSDNVVIATKLANIGYTVRLLTLGANLVLFGAQSCRPWWTTHWNIQMNSAA